MNRLIPLARPLTMEDMLQNSYKNLHTKGLDYLCLYRSDALTIKLYLFSGDVSRVPEVVSPHDHRYPFKTRCLSGSVWNRNYRLCWRNEAHTPRQTTYQMFEWRTPLLGGAGFTWTEERRLERISDLRYDKDDVYFLRHDDIHTIQVRDNETAILLYQSADAVPLDQPTSTFTQNREPPDLTGCYDRFTPDEILQRLDILKRLTGYEIQPGTPLTEGTYRGPGQAHPC
jgi:hypothetical protein